jgi:spermidine/putrescine transport system substrate-binding protein
MSCSFDCSRLFRVFASCLLGLLVAACGREPQLAPEMTLLAPAGSVAGETLDRFTRERGVHVLVTTYSTLAEAREIIDRDARAFDVAIIPDLLVQDLRREGALAIYNPQSVPMLKHVAPQLRNPPHDPSNHHGVPFQWQLYGLAYGAGELDPPQGWSDLFEFMPPGSVAVPDEARMVIGAALMALGASPNSRNADEITQASELILTYTRPQIVAQPELPLIEGGASYAQATAAAIAAAQREGAALAFAEPSEGSLVQMFDLTIPTLSPRKREAHELINFLMDPDVSALNASLTLVGTANLAALERMEPALRQSASMQLPAEPRMTVYVGPEEALYARIWLEAGGNPLDRLDDAGLAAESQLLAPAGQGSAADQPAAP